MPANRALFSCGLLLVAGMLSAQLGQPQLVHPNAFVTETRDLLVHDLNMDGFPDIVLRLYTENGGVGVAFGNGAGQFGPFQYLGGPSDYHSCMRIFDADADGDPDIVFGLANSIVMLANDGAGGFNSEVVLIPNLGNAGHRFFVALDVNQDGAMDIVYRRHQSLVSFRVMVNDGAGGFASAGSWSYSNGNSGALDLACGDVDGDGKQDLVGSYYGHLQLIRFDPVGQPLISYLSFQAFPKLYHNAAMADVDGDGDVDVLAAVNEGAELFLNDGDGTTWSGPVAVNLAPVMMAGTLLAFHDLDLDGDPDLVAGDWSHGFCRFNNDGGGQFGQGQRIWGTSYIENGLFAQRLDGWWHFADLDGDGHVDMLARSQRGVNHFRGTGNGSFEPPVDLFPEMHHDIHVFESADMDGDGRKDLVVVSSGWDLQWYRATGNNGFTGPYLIHQPYTSSYQSIVLDDMDGDGDNDVVGYDILDSVAYIHPNNGDGTFAQRIAITAPGSGFFAVATGDLDGDGDRDLVGLKENTSVAWVSLNLGGGNFTEPYQADAEPWSYYQTADLNQDGRDELLLRLDSPSGGFLFARFDEAGQVVAVDTLNLFGFTDLCSFTDIDMDGDEDILYAYANGGPYELPKIQVAHQIGADQYGEPQGVLWHQPGSDRYHILSDEDMDGDSDPDLLVLCYDYNQTDHLLLLPGLGGGFLGEPQLIYSLSGDIFPGAFFTDALNGGIAKDLVHVLNGRPVWYPNLQDAPYQVRGRFFQDLNANGVRESDEPPFPLAYAHTTPQIGGTIAWPNGEYLIHSLGGTVTVSGEGALNPAIWQLSTPGQHTVNLTSDNPISLNNDFGFVPAADTTVVRLDITPPWGPCSGNSSVQLQVFNEGTRIERGTVEFRMEPPLTPNPWSFVPQPHQVTGSIPRWELGELGLLSSRTYDGSLLLPSASFIGSPLQVQAFAYLVDDSGTPTDTSHAAWNSVTACSYDPNDLLVDPAGYGAHGAIPHTTPYLDYTVRFENTGTAYAFHVEIRIELDPAFDLSHVQLLGFSRQPTTFSIDEDRLLTIRFQNIVLPYWRPESQGHIKFRLWLHEGLPVGTQILNTADIYFDLNPPIITNTTTNTLVDCALWQPLIDDASGYELSAAAGDNYQWYLNGEAIVGATGQAIGLSETGTYTALVTSSDGCIAFTAPVDVVALGASHLDHRMFRLVPNPANDRVHLLFPSTLSGAVTVELINVHGQVVMTRTGVRGSRTSLPIEGLASGVHLIRIIAADGVVQHTERLLIE